MYNIYDELNKITNYIEEHLLEEIDISVFTKLTGMNINVLKSVFTCLTGIGIKEYIRLRRLSLSVSDILKGMSITEVSYKYLYNSPNSFNRAFKNFIGISPKYIKSTNKELKLFNKITFKQSINNYDIDYKIYKNKEFVFYGVSRKIPLDNIPENASKFWNEVKELYPQFKNNIRYGFLSNSGYYYCLLNSEFPNSEKIILPKSNYFAYKMDSFLAKNISNSIKKGITEYITSLNLISTNKPNIEIYYDKYVEILIPIT